MKMKFSDTAMIHLTIGDKVREGNEIGTIRAIELITNSHAESDKTLVALLAVDMDGGKIVVATAEKFEAIPEEEYEVFYPSDLFDLREKEM